MRHGMFVIAVLVTLDAQGLPEVRRLYDAGKFKEVIGAVEQAAAGDTASRLQYLAAQSHEKLNNGGAARQIYQRLANGPQPVWADIGRSALALLDKRVDDALASANNAARDPSLPEAHYQRGIVLTVRHEDAEAAGAFDKATALDPSFAAAHYYGGLANYRIKRIDRTAAHFEAFLKLAPNAPERPEVESIMRTLRGR